MRAVLLIGIHREELAFGEAVAAGLDPARLALLRIPNGLSGAHPNADQAFYYRTNHREIYSQVLTQVRGHYDLVLDLHTGVNEPGRCADWIAGDRRLLERLLDDWATADPAAEQPAARPPLRGLLLTDPNTPVTAIGPLIRTHTVIPDTIWRNDHFRYLGLEVYLPAPGPGTHLDWAFAQRLIEQALTCAAGDA